jgi:Cu(I)/Ag(I) efflux system periplasmic protein CusF
LKEITMKTLNTLIIIASLLTGASISYAASHAAASASPAAVAPATTTETKKEMPAASTLPMASAEIRKIDLENKKITLKHGEIKNLDMTGMTMVFVVKDAAMLDKLAAGDKVMFTADKVGSTFTVMSIEKAK